MKSKQRASAKPKRKPSKLETQLRLSIKFAKLEARINALEAEVLEIGRRNLFPSKLIGYYERYSNNKDLDG